MPNPSSQNIQYAPDALGRSDQSVLAHLAKYGPPFIIGSIITHQIGDKLRLGTQVFCVTREATRQEFLSQPAASLGCDAPEVYFYEVTTD